MRIIAGAPGMVVSLIYPMAGNEGRGRPRLPHPSDPARPGGAARDSGRTVVAGPLPLVQGGEGVIVREPVFLAAAAGASAPRFWGLVSAVIDADRLYARQDWTIRTTISAWHCAVPMEVARRGRCSMVTRRSSSDRR